MTEMVHDYGSLAGALAKAQLAFPPIVRDKEVAVRSYSYKYAPLDAILAAVREPLSSNGLAIAQLLEGPDLVTLLLHESGSTLTARTPLPPWDGVQQYGSMVTYIRRYALTAMLGIATEDDDDGEAAAKPGRRPLAKPATSRMETPDHGGMVGYASAGKGDADMNLRMTPTGHVLAFRLTENLGGTKGFKVLAINSLAEKLAAVAEQLKDQRVTAWGSFSDETFEKDGRTIPYRVLHLERIETPVGVFAAAADDLEPPLAASLEEHVRNRVAASGNLSQPSATQPDPDEDPEVTQASGVRRLAEARAEAECGEVDPGPMALGVCIQPKGHKFLHKSALGTWPQVSNG
jgi:hypothetical protein